MMTKPLLVLALSFVSLNASALSLPEYLEQVKKHSLSYQSNVNSAEGAALQAREADLLFTPHFFAEGRSGHDAKLSSPPVMVYDDLKSQNYSVGVSQQFNFGLKASLSYQLNKTDFDGANFGPNVPTSYWDASPRLEWSLPLWQNGFGRADRANQQLIRSQAEAAKYGNLAKVDGSLIEAEIAYWRLSSAQESLKVQQQALKAAQNIYNYVNEKKRKNLGEAADVLQATALVEAYQLQLKQAEIEEQAAKRNFNLHLNQDFNTEVPVLSALDLQALENVEVTKVRPGDRADVKAAQAQTELARANSQVVLERNRPKVDLYGIYAMNGREAKATDAMTDVNRADRETAFIGVRLQVPLNFSATSDAREGARKSVLAAEQNEKYIKFTQDQHWADLVEKIEEAKATLKLTTAMEKAQKSKLDNERVRLRQGRTTTYQILLFEQDYSQAQASRIRAASQILALQSQLKLYQASNSDAADGI
ncbi:TolC family protein [Pseudobdellovibrio exovorus]|uniref:Putative outer membrane protein n=1 Tax=Pseudobdellovibrio exovorus JSS TaxID=1184267 RepID=M4V978_9BACT|nr:TolC family protein [Pseudobdellovibrio exovorus]AGH95957.1 putative outer membrane protein [Pseudobdellovibrio exovorus JSS]